MEWNTKERSVSSNQVEWKPCIRLLISCAARSRSGRPQLPIPPPVNLPPICPFPLPLLPHSLQSRQIRGSSCVSALKFILIHTHRIIQDEEREIDNQNKDTFSMFQFRLIFCCPST